LIASKPLESSIWISTSNFSALELYHLNSAKVFIITENFSKQYFFPHLKTLQISNVLGFCFCILYLWDFI